MTVDIAEIVKTVCCFRSRVLSTDSFQRVMASLPDLTAANDCEIIDAIDTAISNEEWRVSAHRMVA